MNLPYFIAKRISNPGDNSFSAVIHKIAIASVALGLAIMMIAFFVLGGFQENIKDKIFSFSGHIQIKKFSLNNSYEEEPIVVDSNRLKAVATDPYVVHVQEYAHKPGLISKDGEVYGVLFKGVAPSFNETLFDKYMVEGEFISFNDSTSTDVMISSKMAKNLGLKIGDKVINYFIMDPPKTRRVTVKGIYSTGLDTFDDQMMIGDINVVRSLNGWKNDEVGGYEVYLKNIDDIAAADDAIIGELSVEHYTERVDEKFVQIFDWLNLLSKNVSIFIWLILLVASFNMVSVLFILIMERTQMIGTFKALGASNSLIRRIFSYNGIRLVLKGLLVGNAIAIGFALLQDFFHIIPLDAANYYMEYVPIEWDWSVTIGLNLLTLILVSFVLIIPTTIIARIKPVTAIRFD
ncbi:ABC transporter permease [Roseivirga seohaensis subsp. aquiponti]|uniref:ABC transporter permease n=1 Tax=Roseivirga seohaensis subsp. aquiponti TaxID=1566026 RepID=A0A0L8AK69_9BACT|nr:ABC transporter permease [Roseivirga seohaensis]KOF02789.1 ABC transporter permease [Roseivirga seohaensis subsp. aquiponti]